MLPPGGLCETYLWQQWMEGNISDSVRVTSQLVKVRASTNVKYVCLKYHWHDGMYNNDDQKCEDIRHSKMGIILIIKLYELECVCVPL